MVVAPHCLLVIPDGNRRSATEKGFDPFMGHKQGADNAQTISEAFFNAGGTEFVFWAMSRRNAEKRGAVEKTWLYNLLKAKMRERLKKIDNNDPTLEQVAFRLCARPEVFERDLEFAELAAKLHEKTACFTKHRITVLLEYRGADDIMQASGIVARMGREPHKHEDEVRQHMWISHLKDVNVDLIIRTGVRGDKRNSDSLLPIHGEYAQVRDLEEYWPDLTVDKLYEIFREIEPISKQMRKGA